MGKCRRATKLVLEQLEGSYRSQYNRQYDYAEELRQTNSGSTAGVGVSRLEINGKDVVMFKNFYICFVSLKKG